MTEVFLSDFDKGCQKVRTPVADSLLFKYLT